MVMLQYLSYRLYYFLIIAGAHDIVHEDDSAYKSCSVPDDLSYSSEPYSVVNDDTESGN